MTPLTILAACSAGPFAPTVLHVIGEVDASNASTLADAVTRALAGSTESVTVDCARWTFVDAAGLRVLCHLGDEARRLGRVVFLANMPLRMHELLHDTGVDRHFDLGMAGYR